MIYFSLMYNILQNIKIMVFLNENTILLQYCRLYFSEEASDQKILPHLMKMCEKCMKIC